MTRLLEAQAISVAFGGVQALDDVSVSLSEGERIAVIGPNGAGKSTLVNVLSGTARPDVGRVEFMGQPVRSPHKVARRGLLRTFQSLELFDSLSVYENILVAVQARQRSSLPSMAMVGNQREAKSVARSALVDFGLEGLRAMKAGTLAYGTRKVLELCRVIASGPRAILLDEPVAGLADKTRYVDTLVEALKRYGIAVLLVEHDMSTVAKVAERVLVLSSGQVIASGSYTEIANDQSVVEAYLGYRK